VEPTGAAESDQGGPARIGSLLHRNSADGAFHMSLYHLQETLGQRQAVYPHAVAEAVEDRQSGLEVERQAAAEAGGRIDVAQGDMGVGDSGLFPTQAVGGRSRAGPGAFGADPERAAGIDPGEAPAPGPHRVNGDRGHSTNVAVDGPLVADLRPAALDPAYVGGGAAHVEGDDPAVAASPPHLGGGHDPAGGTGKKEGRGEDCGFLSFHEPSGRTHHSDPVREGRRLFRQPAQITGHPGLEIGIENGCGGPLKLTELGSDAMGEAHRHPAVRKGAAHLFLAIGVDEGVSERHRHRLGMAPPHPLHDGRDVAVEADTVSTRDQRWRSVGEAVVQGGAILTPDLEHVLESGVGDEDGVGSAPLQQGIGGRCRTVE